MENAHARKWPMYLGIGAGSAMVAVFALAAITGSISWVLVPLITSIAGIEMAMISVFTLKGRPSIADVEMAMTSVFTLNGVPKNPVKVADPVTIQAANIEQIAATIEKPALTAEEIENLPHIEIKTENSMPKIESVKLAPSLVNSSNGIYIDSMEVVRQQISQIKVPKETKETKKVTTNEEKKKAKTKTKRKESEGKKKEKVKPRVKNTRRKIVRLVKSTT
jgi:hypothetical protein